MSLNPKTKYSGLAMMLHEKPRRIAPAGCVQQR